MHPSRPLSRPVAVLGMGIVSSAGHTPGDAERRLRAGRGTIEPDPERMKRGFSSTLAGTLRDFDPSLHLKKKERKNMGEHVQYAAVATARAFESSGTDPALFASERAGIIIGNDSSAGSARFVLETTREERSTAGLGSGSVVRCMNSSPTINLGVRYQVRGVSMTLSAADAGGAHALGLSWMMIRTGMLDRMISGGCQETCWEGAITLDASGRLSPSTDPSRAPRPFDASRDGRVPSGGAAILLLEDAGSAAARGARHEGTILAFETASAAGAPPETLRASMAATMRGAIAAAGLAPEDIECINASASGLRDMDGIEAGAIHDVFGAEGPPVTATASICGHEGWMDGASRVIHTLLMMRGGFIPAIANLERPDGDAARIRLASELSERPVRRALVNCFGPDGNLTCIVLGGPEVTGRATEASA